MAKDGGVLLGPGLAPRAQPVAPGVKEGITRQSTPQQDSAIRLLEALQRGDIEAADREHEWAIKNLGIKPIGPSRP